MYRENGGAGAEIVPTSSDFPWWISDLALVLVIFIGLGCGAWLIERWEQASLNVAACTARR